MSAQIVLVVVVDVVFAVLMDVMNDLETAAIVDEKVSYLRRAETSNTRSRI
jgi:hypothetical protein